MRDGTSRWVLAVGIGMICALSSARAGDAPAQTPPVPSPSPPARDPAVEARLRRQDAMIRQLVEQNRKLSEQLQAVTQRLDGTSPAVPPANGPAAPPADTPAGRDTGDDDQPPDIRTDESGSMTAPGTRPAERGGTGASAGRDTSDDEDQPPDIRTDEPESKPKKRATKSAFQEGFEWETEDGEIQLQIHNETQIDTRAYQQPHSDPVNQFGFYVPRMRMYFNGRLTKPFEYSVSFNKGLGAFDLLDAYFNINYDKRLQLRLGRYRPPFTYDFYALNNQFLPTPERSLFAINYGYNRNIGVMTHGELLKNSVDYAVGVFNGPRNSYFDTNAGKDLLAYVNTRPFMNAERLPALKHLNVGASVADGRQNQTPLPGIFRTTANASDSPGQVKAAPSFLVLNQNVVERGTRQLWEIHLAYFYKGLTVMGAWDSGFNDYGRGNRPYLVRLPTQAYHAQIAYFLTGETVERRTFVEPLHPFDLRAGKRGWGAFEVQARFDDFRVGSQVFTGGLADPNLWTDHVYTIDAGVNWYWNKYIKLYFDWQHSVYGAPVPYRPGGYQLTSDLFWLRCQMYF